MRKHAQNMRVERGDFSVQPDDTEEPRTPLTPLVNPAKRMSRHPVESRFSFDVNVSTSRELNKVPLRRKLEDLTRPNGRGEPFGTDILKYWREKKLDPELAKVVALALSAPASQVTVERAFSVLPLIMTDRNTKLTDEYVQKNALIKTNMQWFLNNSAKK